ncbi:MAG: hypothetical protein HYV63_14355 [Candidatus Schekmanbacteria bacterium]|nr:hypothetical protein [Candidatus Schekmanbacteria bacterium]
MVYLLGLEVDQDLPFAPEDVKSLMIHLQQISVNPVGAHFTALVSEAPETDARA